ncbi:hypothetical protein DSO57_1032734 [Entomophthora muscae]|uniref:Uncharacterized protein n=1 Tax=Entomophthora muscae TaxID=34485 RepID=A0ACC2S2J9_9FUNG|nr:hypothetical protein DSO57_1032734 [Entomophthora muscae]
MFGMYWKLTTLLVAWTFISGLLGKRTFTETQRNHLLAKCHRRTDVSGRNLNVGFALALLNKQRGPMLKKLKSKRSATKQARILSRAQFKYDVVSHTAGRGTFDGRCKAAKFGNCAENVGSGRTVCDAIASWMGSDFHQQNILGNYTHAGIANRGNKWTLLLGSRNAYRSQSIIRWIG